MRVKDKVFVITGGGSGMGREITLLLLRMQATVAAIDINGDTLEETALLAKNDAVRLSTHVINVTDKTEIDKLPEAVIKEHGVVDAVINNAGVIQPFVRVNDLEIEKIERIMNINFYGVVYMTKAFLPHLKERPEAHITNISSMGGFLPVPGQTIYGASKAAVKLLTEGLRSELSHTNIGVTVVFPGAVSTNIGKDDPDVAASLDMEKAGSATKTTSADKAAKIIVDGIEKNKYRVLVGADARLMDLIYRINPKRAAAFITKQMKELLPKT